MSEAEFMEAHDAYAEALFRHCYFRIYDRERSLELVQETFANTWEYLSKGNKIENIRAFLYRVLKNLIVNDLRKRKPISLDELHMQGFEARTESKIDRNVEAAKALRVLKLCDPKHRDVIVMRYVDGLGPKEIAEITGESENVVSVRLHRAMNELRSHLHIYEQ